MIPIMMQKKMTVAITEKAIVVRTMDMGMGTRVNKSKGIKTRYIVG